MTKRNYTLALIAGAITLPSMTTIAVAEDAPAAKPAEEAAATKPTGPSLADVLGVSGIDLNGYLDVGYTHLSTSGAFTSGANSRVFDTERNAFNLHQFGLTVAKQPKEGVGGLINITAGRDARIIKSFDQSTSDFDVTQGFLQYATGPLTVIGGKFVTLAGSEVIASTGNTNYSRSILFGYAIPFTHTGVRGTYAANDQTNLIVGVNNGWDQVKDANSQKTLELGATFAPSKILSLAGTIYSGVEQVNGFAPGAHGNRTVLDLVGTYNLSDATSIVANVDYGTQKECNPAACPTVTSGTATAKWSGFALYLNQTLTEQWHVSLRGEYFNDKDGYRTGIAQKWKEVTATLGYSPVKNLELRGELRADFSDKSSFLKTDGGNTKNQQSIGIEAIYKF